jgi:peptidoglycan hydrolase-like protein with peptidoglycan-binding domain
MSISKKLVSIALTATTVVWGSGALLLVPVASAQSATDLQSQIAALLAQIQQLQTQLNAKAGTTSSSSYSYTRDLTVGSKGADVTALQQVLYSKGYLGVAPTGYFGSLTKAAVVAWQKAAGISPASGYFGPKSRAYLASAGVTPGQPYVPSVVAPATGLAVALDSQNPTAGSLISSASTAAARVPVMAIDLTAGNSGGATVTELKFRKTGVVSDSSIAGAYLVENGRVLYQYNSISSGVIDFAGLNLGVNAGQTRVIWLAIDPSTGLSAGNTVGFSLASAADVISVDSSGNAITESGMFPLLGNTFTITTVTNPAIASLTIASSSIGTTVTAGTSADLIGAWTFTATNSKVWLKGIKFTVIGSASNADIRNVKLTINGTQAGATLASVDASGAAYIDATSNPGVLNTGSNNVQLYADVMGSPNKNFQFEVLNSYDVYAVDSQYNVPIAVTNTGGIGTQVSIQQGQITVSQASNTPTGNVAKGATAITLAKFTIYAAGEAVKVKFLTFKLAFTGGAVSGAAAVYDAALASSTMNINVTDDAGGQIGTTINTPPSANTTCDNNGTIKNAVTQNDTDIYIDCFGTATSPVNYIIPANTTRVLSLKADIGANAAFTTVTGSLTGNSTNLQGLTSSASNSSGGASGSALTLSSSSLTAAKSSALGTTNVPKSSSNVRIGSYALTASSADGVIVNTVSITNNVAGIQNEKLMVNGAQFGTTQGIAGASSTYAFSGAPFTVTAGNTTYVDVYADTLSSVASSPGAATTLASCTGTGLTTYNAVTCNQGVTGQAIVLSGSPTVSVTADSSQVAGGQVVMGTSQSPLATFRFTETTNYENVKVTDLTVSDAVATTTASAVGVKAGFNNLTLYNGSAPLGQAGTASASSSPYWLYTFHFATPFVVPQANSLSLVLKGDLASYNSSGATDNTTHVFKIVNTTDVTALGATSNATSVVSITNANGNTQTVLRSNLLFSATPLGAASGRGKTSSDNFATLTFSANSAGAVSLNTLVVSFTGNGASSTNFLDGVRILNESNVEIAGPNTAGTVVATSSAADCAAGNACYIKFNFGSTTNGQQIGSTARNWTLQVNGTRVFASTGTSISSLSATINARTTDVMYTDALDTSASTNVLLPASTLFPVSVNSVSYAVGT